MRTLRTSLNILATKRPALWIGMPLSVAVGLVLCFSTASSIETDSRQRFSAHAQNARNTIMVRIKSYTDVLRGTASTFQTSYPLTHRQFHRYVQGLDLNRLLDVAEPLSMEQQARSLLHQKQ